MATLPTTSLGNRNATFSSASYTTTGTEPVLEQIASAVDTSYVGSTSNATGANAVYMALGAMPSDFSAMLTLSVRLRYAWAATPNGNLTWDSLQAAIVASDGSTAYTNTITLASSITTTTYTNSSATAFTINATGLAATKAQWESALLVITNNSTRSKGGDTTAQTVSAGELTGTYSGQISAALTGSQVTSSAGTLVQSHSKALTGEQVASQTGTIVYEAADIIEPLTGTAVTSSVGTLALEVSPAVTGESVASSAGTLSQVVDTPLSGEAVASSAGTVIPAPEIPVVGVAATASAGTLTTDVLGSRYARPSSDIADGGWLPSTPAADLFDMINEDTFNDSDYIYSTDTSTAIIGLNGVTDPVASDNHVVRYRVYSPNSSSITVNLKQNTTLIATWTHTSLSATPTTYEETLSGAQADSITDYTALRLEFIAGP